MTDFYVDNEGNYLGGFDGAEPPEGAIKVPNPPNNAAERFIDGEWIKPVDLIVSEKQAELDALEVEQMSKRAEREFNLLSAPLLAMLMATLTTEQEAALAAVEAQLYASNIAYKRLKDAEIEAVAKRAEIRALDD